MAIMKPIWIAALLLSVAAGCNAQDRIAALPGEGSTSNSVSLLGSNASGDIPGIPVATGIFVASASSTTKQIYYLSNVDGTAFLSATDFSGAVVPGFVNFAAAPVARSMTVTPAGDKVLVFADTLYAYDVSSGLPVALGAARTDEPISAAVDFAVSLDSRRAFIATGNKKLYAVDLTINSVVGSIDLNTYPTGVAVGPNGLVYVGGLNSVTVVNGASEGGPMSILSAIALPHDTFPSKPVFSASGRYAFVRNTGPGGPAMSVCDLSTGTAKPISLLAAFALVNDFALTGESSFYAVANGALYWGDVDTGSLFAVTSFSNTGKIPNDLSSLEVSREVPKPKWLYIASASANALQVDLTSDLLQRTVSAAPILNQVRGATPGTPSVLTAFNNSQTVIGGGRTLPLVVRAIGQDGRPLSDVPVTWSAGEPEVVVAMAKTNADGYAEAVYKAPLAEGTYHVTADAGSTAAAFSLTVTGSGGGAPNSPDGLFIIRGNGEILTVLNAEKPALEVEVRDKNGKPVADAKVSWHISMPNGSIADGGSIQAIPGDSRCLTAGSSYWGTDVACVTDATGRAVIQFGGTNTTGVPLAYMITATSGTYSAKFYETVLPFPSDGQQQILPQPQFIVPSQAGTVIEAPVGVPIPGAIKVLVTERPGSARPLQYVAVNVSTGYQPQYGPTATCEGGPVLTDANGVATCNVVGGGQPGGAPLKVDVGKIRSADYYVRISVVPGPPKTVNIKNGDNQTGVPGQTLSVPLLAELLDGNGNPAAYADATFEVVKGTATVTPASTKSDAYGKASTILKLGNATGEVQVLVKAGLGQATFKATVKGLASSNFLNGASFVPGVAAGSIVAVAGEDVLGSTSDIAVGNCITKTSATGELPTQLGNIEFWFGTVQAPIFAVCRTGETTSQVNIQVPWEVTPGPLDVTVKSGVGTTAPKENVVPAVNVAAAAPGAFLWATEGKTLAVATREDGSVVTSSKPAKAGDKLRVFATGLGPVAPEAKTNVPGVAGQALVFTPVVQVAGVGASGVRAAYAENSLGVYWVEFVVPATATKGEVPLKLSVTTDKGVLIEAPAASLFVE